MGRLAKVHRPFQKKRKFHQSRNLLWKVPFSGGLSTQTSHVYEKKQTFERKTRQRDLLVERVEFELTGDFSSGQ